MQNFTKEDIKKNAVVNELSVEIRLTLPTTPLKTQQWAEQFCTMFNFKLSETDWGADRFQAVITTETSDADLQCMLCIEWLCEAIWLEPIGTQQSPSTLFNYLMQA
ncbi:DUF3630 family protein [Alteromonas sp. ALT199]|uniref:DUF3630 family protein n=1 Tax=unclassified Alteromonas TaxID=2614992 RepID=UPI00044AAAE4|nr:DUF3630 family protein [Alteromonas sp. ALT199]MBT3135121.1 DUF3630 family protein [Alteromonas sp. ALT199]